MRRRLVPTLVVGATLLPLLVPTSAAAAADFTVVRPTPSGDRFETSASIARTAFPDGAPEAFLVNGDNPVDALAASSVAGPDIPILYTRRDEVPASVMTALRDLDVEDVVLIGGRAVISETVVGQLAGFGVGRVEGSDRYDTAAKLALLAVDIADEPPSEVLLVSGQKLADALSAAPYAAGTGTPLLLTAADHLPAATSRALDALDPADIRVVGGEKAVATDALEGREFSRTAGVDRYATSAAVARWTPDVPAVGFANGEKLVDALPGSVLMANLDGPILLTRPDELGEDAGSWLVERRDDLHAGVAFGGVGSVPEQLVTDARQIVSAPAFEIDVTATDTTIDVSVFQRSDIRYSVSWAPEVDPGNGAWGVPADYPPADAARLDVAPGQQPRITGLNPMSRYTVWVERTVGDLPTWTTRRTVETRFAPPTLGTPRVEGNTIHIPVLDGPSDALMTVFLMPAKYTASGTYIPPTATESGLVLPDNFQGYFLQGGDEGRPAELVLTGDYYGGYELYARALETSNIRDRGSALSYWNSAAAASQRVVSPVPTAPSVTFPAP